MKREFTREEAQRIFAEAAERQETARHTAAEHLTLEELEQAAVAAGIEPAFVREAAQRLVRLAAHQLNRTAGFAAGTSMIFLTGILLYILSFAGPADQIWIPATMFLVLACLFAGGLVAGTRGVARKDADRFKEVVRRTEGIGRRSAATPSDQTERSVDSHEIAAGLLQTDEAEAENPEPDARPRRRTR